MSGGGRERLQLAQLHPPCFLLFACESLVNSIDLTFDVLLDMFESEISLC